MQVPGTSATFFGSMAPMGQVRAQTPQLQHLPRSVFGLAFKNFTGSPSRPLGM